MNVQIKLIKTKIWFLLVFCLTATGIFAQKSSTATKVLKPEKRDEDRRSIDTSAFALNTIAPSPSIDPSVDSVLTDSLAVTFSKDSLNAPVDYAATDSMIYDIANRKIHLYGDATVKYTTINLKADYIVFDWETNIVTAEGRPDSSGRMAGIPEFQDGEQSFTADRMRYNFKTRKGVVYDVTTQQNDVVVLGQRSKFISTEVEDSTQREDVVYSQNAIFTTCNHPEPHYGIRSRKQKVIPNKLVVIGASNLEIMGVPTPLWLPFGFFPIASGRQTGLIFPNDYEYSPSLGFGLREVGWFFPLGEHFNLSLTSDIYLKGTWRVNARSQYRRRYKYNGSFTLGFSNQRVESSDGTFRPDRSFRFQWSHQQASTAHPSNRFGGSINIQTNDFQSQVYNDANSVLQNQLSSNLSFDKNWQDLPISLSAAFNHNQNTATNRVSVSFPNVQFRTQTLYPFRTKKSRNKDTWTNNVTLRYSNDIKNQFDATDTTLFDRETLENARFGVRHNISTGTSFKVFKYFNLNPSFNHREVWYLNTIRKERILETEVDTVITYNADSTLFTTEFVPRVVKDSIAEFREEGFDRFFQQSASISLNTQIFGTMLFKKGWLRGLRHVIKPSIGLSFSPDYLNEDRDWFRFVESEFGLQRYSIFDGGIFGTPSSSGRQMALTYSFNNIFEAKVFSKRDSTEKKVKIFNNLGVNGSYNFAADSLRWSQVSMSGTARFFKGATTLSLRGRFDPYAVNEKGRRIDRLFWKEEGKLLRFVDARATLSTRMTVSKIRAIFQGKEEEVVEDLREEAELQRQRPQETDFLSLFENFSINHNMAFRLDNAIPGEGEFDVTTHAIDIQGSIRLTDNWDMRIGRIGYDFIRKNITYPSIGMTRDLHCWEMGIDWQPVRGTYRFYIQVKPGTLDFLRIPFQRNNVDASRVFN